MNQIFVQISKYDVNILRYVVCGDCRDVCPHSSYRVAVPQQNILIVQIREGGVTVNYTVTKVLVF